jgi:hypothetical protein
MLLKLFINHKEVLLAKTQHQLLHMQGVLAFVQGTEDENNISLNKTDVVTHITKNVIDKVTLKDLMILTPFLVKCLADGVKTSTTDSYQEFTTHAPQCQYMEGREPITLSSA